MSIYFVIASLEGMQDFFAVKKVQSRSSIQFENNQLILQHHPEKDSFSFNLDGASIIYIGLYERSHEGEFGKIEFHLQRYRTSINDSIYKIELIDLLGRIAYGCETILTYGLVDDDVISKSIAIEEGRQQQIKNPAPIHREDFPSVYDEYLKVESTWLDYWKSSKLRLQGFHAKHPKPMKEKYFRSGLSSVLFGKFNENQYNSDLYRHLKKLDWVYEKIEEDAKLLRIDFDSNCPAGCEGLVIFKIIFDDVGPSELFLTDEFPHGVYKPLKSIYCTCPECGSFEMKAEDQYTCLFRNTSPDIVHSVMGVIIERSIGKSIEDQLYR